MLMKTRLEHEKAERKRYRSCRFGVAFVSRMLISRRVNACVGPAEVNEVPILYIAFNYWLVFIDGV